ncbi:rho GTPase-activating protein 190 isoform X2 [Bacillus rossius redtenbacheri]|uniref:rho GTPase-activating protein 190 isoform X2 n=1 Tax=Bacillus rossius redtenbacheri TaxID=93214 RepID=UPI002FDDB39C
MSMARKSDVMRGFNVSVVGLSGTEKEKGQIGVGKSCLCNRFLRSVADEYSVEHISVLSQTDFSGRVVNNDHFLYWGEVTKTSEESVELLFQVVEQTEFIDDASFQPFKGGKMEPYIKRCCATKLTSAEKLMYICKNQLGIEKEYEQKVIPDGKMNIDGFLCVFDVSVVPGRSIEKQVEVVTTILNNLMKTKKPVVLVTTKNDDANESYVKEAEKIASRKEFKGVIPVVETSAHENINVDLAFVTLAQLIDRTKGRCKIVPYIEAAKARKELLESSTEAFHRLIRSQVTDHCAVWSYSSKKLAQHEEFVRYIELFGMDSCQRLFKRHVKKLKDEHLAKRIQCFMAVLPEVLQEMVPDLSALRDRDWPSVQAFIKEHPEFSQYFYECPDDIAWMEQDISDGNGTRIPFTVLDTSEAETVFKNHLNALQQEEKRLELKVQFKQLLEDTGYVTPGKQLSEVRVLFMGRECFEKLSEQDCQYIYDQHQKEIVERAKQNFQELLLEHADLFYHFKSIAPTGTITQEDIKEITDALQDDSRYKALDRLDQDRKLMLFQHLGFVHCPIREHCPAFPNCMDALVERILGTKAHRPSSWNHNSQWFLSSDNSQLNLVILGIDGLAEELANEIHEQCDDDEYEIDCHLYSIDYRIIDGDVSLPENTFTTSNFSPNGCFCVYSNPDGFEYVRDSLEKTLLSNLEQDDRLPFQGLPIVILFVGDPSVDKCELSQLREEGQNLADSLQCPFIDVSLKDNVLEKRFNASLIAEALGQLIQSIHHRAGFLGVYQSVLESLHPDIRIILCMFCGDPYSVENILGPLLSHQCCFLSGERSIILETFLGDSKRKVEVIISSFHGANAFRDELVHGFILVYSTKRKASLATLNAFSMNIPNLPIQILAVTDVGGANAFFSNDLCHLLITEGNATADRLQAHFMTSTSSCQQKTAFFTPFFKEVWEKKPEIEQAFHMEEPVNLNDLNSSGEVSLERTNRHPLPPPRNESYHIKVGSTEGSGSEIYEQLPTDVSFDDGVNEPLSPSIPEERLLSQSDDSDIYSNVDQYSQINSELIIKPSDLKKSRKSKKADISGSQESLATRETGWVEETVFVQRPPLENELWNTFNQHAFTTGRRHISSLKSRPKGSSQTLKQPGKLNLQEFSLVTETIARMNISGKDLNVSKLSKSPFGNAPLATPENVDLGSEYAQVKDAVPNVYTSYDAEYAYALVQDAVVCPNTKSKVRHRREKERTSYSDSDSDWSSVDGRQRLADTYSTVNRKPTPHKRMRKKRAIPVPTPRVPLTQPSATAECPRVVNFVNKDDQQENPDPVEQAKSKTDGTFSQAHDDESSMDMSSPRDVNSPMFGVIQKAKEGDKPSRRKEKQKIKSDEKHVKRRLKEEKLKKLFEKEKERERKKAKSKSKIPAVLNQPVLQDFVQSTGNSIPLLLEKCVRFIEEEGLDSEGIYRVPGNRAHVDLLFHKFEEDPNIDIRKLDIPVNAVATALKDFFSKRLPPLLTQDLMAEIEDISGARRSNKQVSSSYLSLEVNTDRSCRLLALRALLEKLPRVNFEVLKFVFQHFVKVSENCKLNSMDSKNLAICWWPTLLPIEFNDMGRFEQMRPHLEDLVQTMIDQYPFLFCGKEAFVMV